MLRDRGRKHVCNRVAHLHDEPDQALVATGATIAFDAIGGGKLAGQILTAMEAALNQPAKEYSRYGSTTHKQVYLYGGLDTGPTEFTRNFGMAWGMGGWLLMPFLQRIGPHAAQALKQRVADELKTTFASHYSDRSRWPKRCSPTRSPTTASAPRREGADQSKRVMRAAATKVASERGEASSRPSPSGALAHRQLPAGAHEVAGVAVRDSAPGSPGARARPPRTAPPARPR